MFLRIVFVAAALLLAGCQSGPEAGGYRGGGAVAYAGGAAPDDPRYAGLVMDASSGRVLYAEDANSPRYPASLTKMMTLYILFEEIERGGLGMGTELAVSAEAARQPASKLGLKAGSTISVADAVLALAVKSCNDVATAVAENIAGSEPAFAQRMTRTARALGMRNTSFRNASGLPDPAQISTARDMAVLARALGQRFPGHYHVFSTDSFTYAGRRYESTNKLLGEVPGMDFGKTGYTRASGYNLATSVQRGGKRIIVVALGAPSSAARNAHVSGLIAAHLPSRAGWLVLGN